jgi:hypothetical protein
MSNFLTFPPAYATIIPLFTRRNECILWEKDRRQYA